MVIRYSFDERFTHKLYELRDAYGDNIFKFSGISSEQLDVNAFAQKFFKSDNVAETSVDGNSNVDDTSCHSFHVESAKASQKLDSLYILWKKIEENPKLGVKRANKILEQIVNGTLRVHDCIDVNRPYCYALSLEPMVTKGLPYIKKIKIGPPRHLSSYINLSVQLVSYVSNQILGAGAFPDFFIYFDYYARKDYGENYLETSSDAIEQELQSLIYSLNYPFRGSQSAFTNLSVYDKYFLESLFSNTYYPDMSRPHFESIQKLQKFYVEFFVKQSMLQTFTFPVNTANFYVDETTKEVADKEFLDFISEWNCHNGTFNIYTGPLSSLSSCCRLRNDTSKIKEYTNSFGSGGVSIGSSRVVTLNLPRLAYVSETKEEFVKNLEYNVKCCHDLLEAQRSIVASNIQNGRLPLYSYGFMELAKQYMTIGFIGMNECLEILGDDIVTDEGTKFAQSILNKINAMNDSKTKEDGLIRNMEQIPGESAAVDFAKIDKVLMNGKYPIYSNQFIPLWKNVDVSERLRLQGLFDSSCQGGAICHINVDYSIDKSQMKQLIENAASKGVVYFAINILQARCNNCGKLFIGKHTKSPCHNADVTNYLRIVGFLTAVETTWSPDRQVEYKTRQFYSTDVF